jgi:tripartite-type tricarboxylate transporter receptor subunit TctC
MDREEPMALHRRTFVKLLAGTPFVAAAPRVARAQANWPDHPVRVVVPYPAGGSTDVLARILAESLKDKLGQPFVIENRPGAGGNTGIASVTGSPPDGYTIGAATVGHFAINQFLYDKMPYDPEKDFIPVTMTWDLPNVFAVSTQHCPAKTLAEFVAWAKASGKQITFGSPGVGTSPHLSGALFATRTGIAATHVPFRGAAQTIPAILSGDVTYAIDNLESYTSFFEAGTLRALAVTSAERWPTQPNVPTMAEAGQKDFVITSWAGFFVPAGTPKPVVEKLGAAMKDIAADKAIQQKFLVAGARLLSSTPEFIADKAAKERPMWQEVIKISGAKAG